MDKGPQLFPCFGGSAGDNPATPGVVMMLFFICVVVYEDLFLTDSDDEDEDNVSVLLEVGLILLQSKRPLLLPDDDSSSDDGGSRKRRFIGYDWERARHSVSTDYMGPMPTFNDRQFERVFRVTRSIAQTCLSVVAEMDPFFHQKKNCLGKLGICPNVKILTALKLLAYGVSASAFQDYFQMGLSTAQECMVRFAKCVSTSEELLALFMRNYNRPDAKRVSELHEFHHGVRGLLGSLDCMHWSWKNCPYAWKGQFQGKEKRPTVVLEAVVDFNLWIWHVSFGHAGSLNDINIWDKSPLLKSFMDGTFHEEVDFEFLLGGVVLNHLWFLVDGIYPELSRFSKTLSEPTNPEAANYALWQEASRKDVERGFGVLQRKFHILVKSCELWYVEDMESIMKCCVILHNMMVQHRVHRDEQESSDMYEYVEEDDAREAAWVDADVEFVARRLAEFALHRNLEDAFYNGPTVSRFRQKRKTAGEIARTVDLVNRRWDVLHDVENHV